MEGKYHLEGKLQISVMLQKQKPDANLYEASGWQRSDAEGTPRRFCNSATSGSVVPFVGVVGCIMLSC